MKIDFPYLLLSVILALLLWTLAANTRGEFVEKNYSVPIQLQNQTSLKVVNQSVQNVVIKVRVSREFVRKTKPENFVVKGIIPAGTQPGQFVVFLRYELPPGTTFVTMFPDEVMLELK